MGVATVDRKAAVTPTAAPKEITAWQRRFQEYRLMLRMLMKSPLAATGLIIVLIYAGIVIYAQFLPDNEVMLTNFAQNFPVAPFWWPGGTAQGGILGTTANGIDLLDAIIKAIRIDLIYTTFVVVFGAVIGALIGLYAGYRGGLFDEALMRITDVTYSIPFLVFVIAVAFAFQKKDFLTVNKVLLILWWPPTRGSSARRPFP